MIIGAPRSGTTLLFRCLAVHQEIWHLPSESHSILEGPLHPRRTDYSSNCATAESLDDSWLSRLAMSFFKSAININLVVKNPLSLMSANTMAERIVYKTTLSALGFISKLRKPADIRFLEKTPKNSLRVPLIDHLFQNARFIWITREPYTNILSIAAGWRQSDRIGPFRFERFARAGYPIMNQLNLADYDGGKWKFALIPGWRDLKGGTTLDVAARQYYQCNRIAMEDLQRVESSRVKRVRYEELISNPKGIISSILEWADLERSLFVDEFIQAMPRVNQSRTAEGAESEISETALLSVANGIPGFEELMRGLKGG